MKSVEIVIMVVLGGMGSVSGSILAAFLLTLLPEALRPLQDLTGVDLRMVIYSLALILMMLLRPKGLFGRKELWEMLRKRRA
jgi:branched-chain amino acid transport system permease protein